jgi:hypothetical protein
MQDNETYWVETVSACEREVQHLVKIDGCIIASAMLNNAEESLWDLSFGGSTDDFKFRGSRDEMKAAVERIAREFSVADNALLFPAYRSRRVVARNFGVEV